MDGTQQRQLFSSAAVTTLHGPAALRCAAQEDKGQGRLALSRPARLPCLRGCQFVFLDRTRCYVLPLLGTHIEDGGLAARCRRIPAYPLRRCLQGPLAFSPFAHAAMHALGWAGFAAGSAAPRQRRVIALAFMSFVFGKRKHRSMQQSQNLT